MLDAALAFCACSIEPVDAARLRLGVVADGEACNDARRSVDARARVVGTTDFGPGRPFARTVASFEGDSCGRAGNIVGLDDGLDVELEVGSGVPSVFALPVSGDDVSSAGVPVWT